MRLPRAASTTPDPVFTPSPGRRSLCLGWLPRPRRRFTSRWRSARVLRVRLLGCPLRPVREGRANCLLAGHRAFSQTVAGMCIALCSGETRPAVRRGAATARNQMAELRFAAQTAKQQSIERHRPLPTHSAARRKKATGVYTRVCLGGQATSFASGRFVYRNSKFARPTYNPPDELGP